MLNSRTASLIAALFVGRIDEADELRGRAIDAVDEPLTEWAGFADLLGHAGSIRRGGEAAAESRRAKVASRGVPLLRCLVPILGRVLGLAKPTDCQFSQSFPLLRIAQRFRSQKQSECASLIKVGRVHSSVSSRASPYHVS
jgi:hypothetical protein